MSDITTGASRYCLLKVMEYDDRRKRDKKLIFVDPGVYELMAGKREYSCISFLHRLASLSPEKLDGGGCPQYLSIDYPCDMNPAYSKEFVEKSVRNNFTYAENPRYICTIQHAFQDLHDFKRRFEELEPVFDQHRDKIIGFGNMGRLINGKDPAVVVFVNGVFEHAMANLDAGRWIHIYGMPLWMIRAWVPRLETRFRVSIDSTKWTFPNSKEARAASNGRGYCTTKNRGFFFTDYVHKIQDCGIKVKA